MKKNVSVKICKLKDARFLLEVYNSGITGGFFKSNKTIKFKDHILWLKKKLNNSSSKIYIGYKNKIKFGYARFDKIKINIFEVSICNHHKYYGKGLGTKMLRLAIKKFIKYNKAKKIISVVKRSNFLSQKCFLKNNFKKIKFDRIKHRTHNKINTKKEYYYEYLL